MSDLPRSMVCGEAQAVIRRFRADDLDAMLAFARALPEHDLLFLGRDLKHRKVIEAWLGEVEDGFIDSLVADVDGMIVATSALVRDPFGWSPHVGELRLLVAPDMRGHGLGRAMLEESLAIAAGRALKKITARMTPDQSGAIQLFEGLGFRGEALLKDQVMGRDGQVHDLAVLSLDMARSTAMLSAFGMT